MVLIFQMLLLIFSIVWMLFSFSAFIRTLIDLKDINNADSDGTEDKKENSQVDS